MERPLHLALAETKQTRFDRIPKDGNPYPAHRLVGPFPVRPTGVIAD
ncbi:MAG: hypothetical protein P1U81_14975 [Verrucomicrobiales bacterium]|nr:hypothetical protein [Verrucomicrobiales bacterium]